MLAKWIAFIKGHERLLLALMAGIVIYYAITQIRAYEEHQLQVQADLKNKELADAKEASRQASAQVTEKTATNAKVDTQALQIIANLQARVNGLEQELANRQKAAASMTDQQLAARWGQLAGVGGDDLVPTAQGVQASHTAAVITVQRLEEVPALESKIEALNGVIDQREGQITAKSDLIASLKDDADKAKVVLAKQEAACEANTKLAVQQERDKKSKTNLIVRGVTFVLGVVLGTRL